MNTQDFPSYLSKNLQSKDKPFQKSVLVIEDYIKKNLLNKVSIMMESSYEKKCTVINFSPSGKYLALGNEEGNILLFSTGSNQKGS